MHSRLVGYQRRCWGRRYQTAATTSAPITKRPPRILRRNESADEDELSPEASLPFAAVPDEGTLVPPPDPASVSVPIVGPPIISVPVSPDVFDTGPEVDGDVLGVGVTVGEGGFFIFLFDIFVRFDTDCPLSFTFTDLCIDAEVTFPEK